MNSNSGHFCDNVISEYRGPVVFTILWIRSVAEPKVTSVIALHVNKFV